jgi:hypothetical protein
MKSNTVLLVTNIPTPYRVPLFNELNRQLTKKGLKLKVIFGALGHAQWKWLIDTVDIAFYMRKKDKTQEDDNAAHEEKGLLYIGAL